MPTVTIDGRSVAVPPGTTILEAAARLGIEIPTLCYLPGCRPGTSCLVCLVKLCGANRLVPSCATAVVDGMEIESETDEVRALRRTSLELLLSEHHGDCLGPCQLGCPAHMDIPRMLRAIAAGDFRRAIATIKEQIALPAVLGYVCPKPCEKTCRRAVADHAVAICDLKRLVAEADLQSGDPYLPECSPATGKCVSVVGAGPTGLAAAYYLRRAGHEVVLWETREILGGRLREQFTAEQLPRTVLDAEIGQALRLGVDVRTGAAAEVPLDELRRTSDAVLLSCGAQLAETIRAWGLAPAAHGIEVTKGGFATNVPGVFAAGSAIHKRPMVVRSVADGHEVAEAIGHSLRGEPTQDSHASSHGTGKTFSVRLGRLERAEVEAWIAQMPAAEAQTASTDPLAEAAARAARCLHCDCVKADHCRLRTVAARYGADPHRYRHGHVPLVRPVGREKVVYDASKCIRCGLCIEIATTAGESLGLAFIGRGFDVRVGVPFDRSLEEALAKTAERCIAACPTAALAKAGP